MTKELDHEDGELTATQKIKREASPRRSTNSSSRCTRWAWPRSAIGHHGWIAQAEPAASGASALDRFITTFGRGLAQGSIYAIVALGFVLVFKATQAVNFAQGAIGLVTAWFFSMLLVDWDIPGRWLGDNAYVVWFSTLVVALALAAVFGLVIERLIIRPMIGEPLFSIAVITLGLEAVLRTIGADAVIINNRRLEIPWGADQFEIGGRRSTGRGS